MKCFSRTLAAMSMAASAALALYETAANLSVQQGVPSQPGQPSTQPPPSEPSPNPTNPPPTTNQPETNQPITQPPTAQRLIAMEQRLTKSNQDLLKRLGEARQLPAERQNAAMFDVLQQVLLEQAQLNQYLIQARTAWTSDCDTGTNPPR